MFRVALTGGIGSGKTTVAKRFAEHDIAIVDADAIARRITEAGQPAATEILSALGESVADGEGNIERKKLAEAVFSDSSNRKRLEDILHPRIRGEMIRAIESVKSPYCILVIPLLVESSMQDLADRIVTVDVAPETQVARTRERDGRSEKEIRAILQAQASRAQRLAVADDVITNEGGIEQLYAQIDRLHETYLKMASTASA